MTFQKLIQMTTKYKAPKSQLFFKVNKSKIINKNDYIINK